VQVETMKPKLKPPGTKRLKLKCDVLLSTLAFKINLRRYMEDRRIRDADEGVTREAAERNAGTLGAGAYPRPLLSST